jgi:transcriptional regulator with XRE-family HTH domain
MTAGAMLRALREGMGLTIRDVENATTRLADKYGNPEFCLQLSRISDIETKGVVPSIFRLYALAVVYRRDVRELMGWYGIDTDHYAADTALVEAPKSHRAEGLTNVDTARVPVKMDPGFNLARTTNIGRMVQQWGSVPMTFLHQLEDTDFTYFYVGTEDLTMYPLLMPGSFVQVDESQNKVTGGPWSSEYERPIYCLETRGGGYRCSWCELDGDKLILQPHPLSGQKTAIYKHPQDAEVVGRIVAVAMRLGDWKPVSNSARPKAIREQN